MSCGASDGEEPDWDRYTAALISMAMREVEREPRINLLDGLPAEAGAAHNGGMVKPREYEVVLQPETEGGYSVVVPGLPGCASQGETREEALAMIKEAIEGYLESLKAHGEPIPEPPELERVTVGA